MNQTFRKYEKIYRIEMPDYRIKGKYHLAKKVEELLFKGIVVVTEKIDGANTGIMKVNGKTFLQKKGDNIDFSHPQYSFFYNEWFFQNQDKIDKLPDNIVVYGELMRCVHTIYYNKLPDWFLVFDIFDLKQNKYLEWKEIKRICDNAGLSTVPFLYEGKLKKEDLKIPNKSQYGDIAEGVVVKNYQNQVRGKYVKPEFVKAVDESEFWRKKKIKLNKVVK